MDKCDCCGKETELRKLYVFSVCQRCFDNECNMKQFPCKRKHLERAHERDDD
jgi:hypothetical protein